MMRAELFREGRLAGTGGDRRDAKSHGGGELNAEMPKPANALHSNEVPGLGGRTAQGVVGGQSSAEQRRRVCGTQVIRNGDESAGKAKHDLGIAAVVVDAGNWMIRASDEITATT